MNQEDLNRLAESGLKAGRERNYAEAVRIFTSLAQHRWPLALLYLGRAYHGLGDSFMAAQVLRDYVATHPDSSEGWFFLGRAYLGLGLPSRAVSGFRKAGRLGYSGIQFQGLLGSALLKDRRPEEAAEVLRRAVEGAPGHQGILLAYWNTLLVLALKNFHLHRYPQAREILEYLEGQGLESPVIPVYLGNSYRQLGLFDLAYRQFHRAALLSPGDVTLRLHMAECLIHTGQADQARELLRAAGLADTALGGEHTAPGPSGERKPQSLEQQIVVRLLEEGKHRQAIFHCLKALKEGRGREDFYHHGVSKAYYALGDKTKALAHLHQVRKHHPRDTGLLYETLSLLWEQADFGGIRKEVRNFPGHETDRTCRYYDLLARCSLNPGDAEDLAELKDFEASSPPDPFLYQALALCESAVSGDSGGVTWAKKALKLHPALEGALGVVLEAEEGSKGPVKGLKALLKAYLGHRPEDARATKAYVRILFREGLYTQAAVFLRKEIGNLGPKPGLLRALAYCYRQDSQWEKALALYHSLLQKDPQNPVLLANTLYCMDRTGRKEAATRLAGAAVQAQPRNAGLMIFLARSALARRNLAEAGRLTRKALEINPKMPEAWDLLGRIAEAEGSSAKARRYDAQARKNSGT